MTGDLGNRTARAIAWLKDNYAKRLHMEELAGVARIGVSTLHHQFRSLTAMSPLQYQKQLRLQRAREQILWMGWTPRAQLTRSATRASANSTESTAASLASLPCAMSKLFERTALLPHELMAGATGLEPAASCVTGRRANFSEAAHGNVREDWRVSVYSKGKQRITDRDCVSEDGDRAAF